MMREQNREIADLVREEQDNFLVHRRLFTDAQIFEREMQRIFHRSWVYVGHESEIAAPGDYKTTSIGRQPVIVTRSVEDGRVRVLHNRCRHRGTTVTQKDQGNQRSFTCPYHGWTYNGRGELVGVPLKEGYGPSFKREELGLVQVARVESYGGLIFASMNPEANALQEHLGNARLYIDLLNSRGPLQLGKLGVHRVGYSGNWKLQMDNNVDSYHVPFLHATWQQINARRAEEKVQPQRRMRALGNGHGTSEAGEDPLAPGYDPRKDPWRPFQLSLCPNASILALPFFGPQIRVIHPIRVDRTEVWHYPFLFADEKKKLEQMRGYELFYGPGGVSNPDDREMFERIQVGLQSEGTEWSVLSRGMHVGQTDERGIRTDTHHGEAGQRGFYQTWKRWMA
jgi:phenylpropionate dioxygenase-like ring-hydroxylating dioxygenase large terminal subunit